MTELHKLHKMLLSENISHDYKTIKIDGKPCTTVIYKSEKDPIIIAFCEPHSMGYEQGLLEIRLNDDEQLGGLSASAVFRRIKKLEEY